MTLASILSLLQLIVSIITAAIVWLICRDMRDPGVAWIPIQQWRETHPAKPSQPRKQTSKPGKLVRHGRAPFTRLDNLAATFAKITGEDKRAVRDRLLKYYPVRIDNGQHLGFSRQKADWIIDLFNASKL